MFQTLLRKIDIAYRVASCKMSNNPPSFLPLMRPQDLEINFADPPPTNYH